MKYRKILPGAPYVKDTGPFKGFVPGGISLNLFYLMYLLLMKLAVMKVTAVLLCSDS
jgi:hypothetical protein